MLSRWLFPRFPRCVLVPFCRAPKHWWRHHSTVSDVGFSGQFYELLKLGAMAERSEESMTCSWDIVNSMRCSLIGATRTEGKEEEEHLTSEVTMRRLCTHYESLDHDAKQAALFLLSVDFGLRHDDVITSASELIRLQAQNRADRALFKCEKELRKRLSPFYCDVFSEIAKLEGGTKFLVDFRADIMKTLKKLKDKGQSNQVLMEMDRHLRDLLRQWFMPQLLELHQVTWQSPCDLLEKVSSYEAVHPLRHWKDLKHRLGANRRCYIFMHKTLPREPLVIMHTALTSEPASSMKTLLDRKLGGGCERITTANFYSISNTQGGLAGVSLGTALVKKVVEELRREFPEHLSTFVTLSPIPGFRDWLNTRLNSSGDEDASLGLLESDLTPLMQLLPGKCSARDLLRGVLNERGTLSPTIWNRRETELTQALATPLTKLCARYLICSKRRGYALDPVANFHLRNGACVWRLNWLADTSLYRSYGLMVNYKYDLPLISRYSQAYIASKKVNYSSHIRNFLE